MKNTNQIFLSVIDKKTKEETVSYIITIALKDKITDKVMIENINEIFKRHGGVKKDNSWIIIVE